MEVNLKQRTSFGALCLCLLAAVVVGGCRAEVVVEEEPVSMVEEQPDMVFPAMLHNQRVKATGFSQRLQLTDISDLELVELSEPAPDGAYTAVVSFIWKPSMQPYDVQVRVTYKKQAGENDDGFAIESYPVSKLETLSIKRSSS